MVEAGEEEEKEEDPSCNLGRVCTALEGLRETITPAVTVISGLHFFQNWIENRFSA